MVIISSKDIVQTKIALAVSEWSSMRDINAIRERFESLLEYKVDIHQRAVTIDDMQGVIVTPTDAGRDKIILYCHGGGFQIGSTRSHLGLMARISKAANIPVFGFDYRLAPEHKCPAAIIDTIRAYQWSLESGYHPSNIAIVGDSAGAALAVNICIQKIKMHLLPRPACLVLISPWLDLSLSGESYVNRADLDIFSKPEQLRAMARSYTSESDSLTDPTVSPLFSNPEGLPPTLIHAGDFDITLDDAKSFADSCKSSGVNVELEIWPEMFHHFQVFEELPEAHESVVKIGKFIRLQTDRQI